MPAALLRRESAQCPALSSRIPAGTAKPEVEEPHRLTVWLAALGTGALFLESLVYIVFARSVTALRCRQVLT